MKEKLERLNIKQEENKLKYFYHTASQALVSIKKNNICIESN